MNEHHRRIMQEEMAAGERGSDRWTNPTTNAHDWVLGADRKPRGIKATRKQDESGHYQRTHVTDLHDALPANPAPKLEGSVSLAGRQALARDKAARDRQRPTFGPGEEWPPIPQASAPERKGASYRVTSSRSHDYSGTTQSPHHSRPMGASRATRQKIADDIATNPGDYRDDY